MEKKIQLIVCDMDGTLLNSNKEITEETKKAIREAREKGIEFTICTGRVATMIGHYVKALDIRIPIITSNGAALWDPLKKEILCEHNIAKEVALKVVRFCEKYQMDCSILTMNACYFTKNSIRINRFLDYNKIAKQAEEKMMDLIFFDEAYKCLDNKNIHKILIYERKEEKFRKAIDFLQSIATIDYTSSEPDLIDISAKGVNKGLGLKNLMSLTNHQKENVSAFGDYYNDMSMLQEAGIAIAMANGCTDIRKMATYITKSNDEEGIAYAIRKYIL